MATTLLDFDSGNAQFIWDEMKQVWLHNRQFNGFPTCTLKLRNTANADPLTGVDNSTWDDVVGKVDIYCDFENFTTEEVASAGGLLLEGDKNFVAYDLGELGDFNPYRIEVAGVLYLILSENYESFSGMSTLILRESEDV